MSADLPPIGSRVRLTYGGVGVVVRQSTRSVFGVVTRRALVEFPSTHTEWVTADEIEVLPTEHPTSTSNLGAEVSDDVA